MNTVKESRRGFFKAVAIGGATAAAAVATTVVGKRIAPTNVVSEDQTRIGYRETAHVRQYYRTTQI